jgi:hypothetical protein
MFASLGFVAMLGIGAIFVGFTGGLPGQSPDFNSRAFQIGGIAVEAAIVLLAAWRFRMGKGGVFGAIVLLLFMVEIGFKLFGGFQGILWYVAYLAIFLGLVNGVRGAWALRSMENLPPDLSDTFA